MRWTEEPLHVDEVKSWDLKDALERVSHWLVRARSILYNAKQEFGVELPDEWTEVCPTGRCYPYNDIAVRRLMDAVGKFTRTLKSIRDEDAQ